MKFDTDRHTRLDAAHAAMNRGDYAEARRAFEQLDGEGESQALIYLAWMDEQAMGAPRNVELAATRYGKLAEAGDPLGAYYLASLKLRGGNATTALELFKVSADADNPSGAYWASAIYGGEGGFPVNTELEDKYLHRAAQLGHFFAKRDIARRSVHRASNLLQKLIRIALYQFTKLRGFAAIIRNPTDLRVR